MRSGLDGEEFYEIGPVCEEEMVKTDDWVASCLAVDLVREPGLNWSYNSNEPMLMGEIIARASGMSIMEFAKAHLFRPLGIQDYEWTVSPKGQGMAAGSFYMKPSDMLKVINLVRSSKTINGNEVACCQTGSWLKPSSTTGPLARAITSGGLAR
jgi:CubicO group peptidase (beta-lactamase class C family)